MRITLRSGNIQNDSKKEIMNFKKTLFALPFMALVSCGGTPGPADGTDTTKTSGIAIIDSNTVTSSNAAEVKFHEDNVESVTRYFYASRIRGDKDWESVCHLPEERTPRFADELVALDKKDITRYKHLETDCLDNVCNVQIELDWTDDSAPNKFETSEYIVFLENIDGIWWIIGFSDAVQA